MLKKFNDFLVKWFYGFLELQLVISLMSLPILTCWGLPISYMSPLSNMIFTPLLILFLWTSCLFAACALVGLPCSWFVWIMDSITALWGYILSFASPFWLIGFSQSTLWISCIFCIFVYMLYTYIKPNTKNAVAILFMFWLTLIGCRQYMQKNICQQVGDLPMVVLRINKKTYVIDYGALCTKQNFYTYIDYTIMPTLIKATGITTINTLVICKPSAFLAKAAHQFAQQTKVETIIVTKKAHCFEHVKKLFEGSNVIILPLTKPPKKSHFKTKAPRPKTRALYKIK